MITLGPGITLGGGITIGGAAPGAYIDTPVATPAAFGDALEGGFYTGMIWNELVQSATSTTVGTGTKVFTVPDMGITPIVYAGQTLEVRSRADPVNKMVGTVTSALGTTLTLDITSVGGSGTFTDWSVMARYRVIVSPKATGNGSSLKWKSGNSVGPTACITLAEGYLATNAMVAAGDATVYPAAHFCNNLSIAGYTDWYLPARDELELCWRNLKPVTDNNYTGSVGERALSAYNYTKLGSLTDIAREFNINRNSSPEGAVYTTTVPGQVANAAFQTGGAEAFVFGSGGVYWSSSEYSAGNGWAHAYYTSQPGIQYPLGKTNAIYVRAVRRSII